MSQRSLVEINHDLGPGGTDKELLAWARKVRTYVRSGSKEDLPDGFEVKWRPAPFGPMAEGGSPSRVATPTWRPSMLSNYDIWKTTPPEDGPCRHERATHGSPELDDDAKMLLAMGADPGPMECSDCGDLIDHKLPTKLSASPSPDDEPF